MIDRTGRALPCREGGRQRNAGGRPRPRTFRPRRASEGIIECCLPHPGRDGPHQCPQAQISRRGGGKHRGAPVERPHPPERAGFGTRSPPSRVARACRGGLSRRRVSRAVPPASAAAMCGGRPVRACGWRGRACAAPLRRWLGGMPAGHLGHAMRGVALLATIPCMGDESVNAGRVCNSPSACAGRLCKPAQPPFSSTHVRGGAPQSVHGSRRPAACPGGSAPKAGGGCRARARGHNPRFSDDMRLRPLPAS